MNLSSDTIVAIATSPGTAAIGIIRLSGSNSLAIFKKIWQGPKLQPRHLTLGWILDKKIKLDQALAVYMPSPHSYTGDDVVEIQLHGSRLMLDKVLSLLVSGGTRLAEPGEFTKRAYLNGKLDFTQAEAVAEIVTGEHEALLKLSADQLAGGISKKTTQIKAKLAQLCAKLVAQLDFSEDDVTDLPLTELVSEIVRIDKSLNEFSQGGDTVVALREGIKIALIGLPNAGKSTLLNKLLGWDRAIVTDIAGTTRDIIEENINIDGYNFRVVDTAGLNSKPETIEKLGIERTISELKRARLIMLLIEPGQLKPTLQYLDANNLDTVLNKDNTLVVMTKSDLKSGESIKKFDHISVSRENSDSINRMREKIVEKSINKIALESVSLTTRRQLDCVKKAQDAIIRAKQSAIESRPYDVILVDLEDALMSFNELTGEQVSAQVIDELFTNFCIGK